MIELYNQNCLDFMDEMIKSDRGGVEAIITSPPYNLCLKVQNGKYKSRWESKYSNIGHLSNKYKNYTDDLPMELYERFQDEFLSKALQLTNRIFYNIQMVTGNKVALLHLLGKYADKIKEIIIWDKVNSEPAINKGMLNSAFEFIIVFENSKPYQRSFENPQFQRGTESNIWHIKRKRNKYIRAGFPDELVERIITNFTTKGSVIFDPFMGSGTTGIISKKLGRSFIGCELDTKMFNIAKERIEQI